MNSKLFRNFGADEIDESQYIAGFGARMGHNKIRMSFADFCTTDSSPFQAGLFN